MAEVLTITGCAQTLHDTGDDYKITPSMDGGVYGTAVSDCVCRGIGDEFALVSGTNYSSNSFQIDFNIAPTGGAQAVIGGAFFRLKQAGSLVLGENGTYNIVLRIDTGAGDGLTGSIMALANGISLETDNLNSGGNAKRDLLLYEVTTNGSGVNKVTDKRVIAGDGGAAIAGLDFNLLSIIAEGAFPVLTTAPNAAYNKSVTINGVTYKGRKLVYLTSDPGTKYSGYIYLIKE